MIQTTEDWIIYSATIMSNYLTHCFKFIVQIEGIESHGNSMKVEKRVEFEAV